MKRFLFVAIISVVPVVAVGACNKPSSEDCQRAIANTDKLLGTDNSGSTADLQGEIRRCQGGSSRETVACRIKATTPAELKACTKKSAE
jgi:hypothetical protein